MSSPTLFLGLLVLAALLVGLFVAWPLLRRRSAGIDAPAAEAARLNQDIIRERRQKLDEELAALPEGSPEREALMREFATGALADLAPADAPTTKADAPRRRQLLAVVFITLLVALPLAFYRTTGMPQAVAPDFAEKSQMPDVNRMLAQLEARLEAEPEMVEGWLMLGRSRLALGEGDKAVEALERALKLDSEDPALAAQIRTDLADALGRQANSRLEGRPWALIQEALARQPNHPKAMALAGAYQLSQNRPAQALAYWEPLLQQLKPGTPQYEQVEQYIAGVRAKANAGPRPGSGNAPQKAPSSGANPAPGPGEAMPSTGSSAGKPANAPSPGGKAAQP